jgi:hypothetical protein
LCGWVVPKYIIFIYIYIIYCMYQMASVMRTLEIFDMDDTWGVMVGRKIR